MKRIYYFLILFFLLMTVFQNCKEALQEVKEVDVEILKQNAVITFLSGEAFIFKNNSWEPVDVGDDLEPGSRIQVAEDSFCEIQFGDKALIRIEENTEICLEYVLLEEENSNVGLNMVVGTVLCQVSKLVGDDSFDIITNETVAGVRGTEFMVQIKEEGTLLAVKSGSVAVMPTTVNIRTLKEKLKKTGTEQKDEILLLLAKLEESAQIVTQNQEIIVEDVDEETESGLKEIEKIVDGIVEEETVSPQGMEELNQKIDTVVEEIKVKELPVQSISEESSERLKQTENMRMIQTSIKTSGDESLEETEEEPEDLIKIVIIAEPKDSSIFINDKFMGRGRTASLFPRGDEVSVTVKRAGFLDEVLVITVDETVKPEYLISLKKEEEVVETEKPVEEEEETKEIAETDEEEETKETVETDEEEEAKIKEALTPEEVEQPVVQDTNLVCTDWSVMQIGEFLLQNNVWGKEDITDYEQCLFKEEDGVTYGFRWDWPSGGNVRIKAFPEVVFGLSPWLDSATTSRIPIRVSDIEELVANYDIAITATGKYNLKFDIWLNSSPEPNEGNVVILLQIWLAGYEMIPGGDFLNDVKIDGEEYEIYKYEITSFEERRDPVIGIAFYKLRPELQGKTKIHKFLDYLLDKKFISLRDYVSSIHLGIEIIRGTGEARFKSYSIQVNSGVETGR